MIFIFIYFFVVLCSPQAFMTLKMYVKLFVKIAGYERDYNRIFVVFQMKLTNQKRTFLRNFLSSQKSIKILASHW